MELKSEKGVTLTSIIIYIIGMVIMATIIGNLTIYFYNNLVNTTNATSANVEYIKFNTFFLDDIKQNSNRVLNISDNGDLIQFSNGSTYFYENKIIYKNTVKICDEVDWFKVKRKTTGIGADTKVVLEVKMQVGNKTYTTNYVVR